MKVHHSSLQMCKNFLQLGPPAIFIESFIWDLICDVGGALGGPSHFQNGETFSYDTGS